MKRKFLKIICLLLATFIIISTFCTISVKAIEYEESNRENISIDTVTDGASGFLEAGQKLENPMADDGIKNVSDVLYNILLIVGIIAAVIVRINNWNEDDARKCSTKGRDKRTHYSIHSWVCSSIWSIHYLENSNRTI